ncbi:MAG TPA: hypothetical protein VHA52_09800 [Candidatus Babeliaceae bacterium]|nr:hypothetical protein [Candidatus Babeliaceae bacterium]
MNNQENKISDQEIKNIYSEIETTLQKLTEKIGEELNYNLPPSGVMDLINEVLKGIRYVSEILEEKEGLKKMQF